MDLPVLSSATRQMAGHSARISSIIIIMASRLHLRVMPPFEPLCVYRPLGMAAHVPVCLSQKCPLPLGDLGPHLIAVSWALRIHIANGIPISHDQQTRRQTDRHTDIAHYSVCGSRPHFHVMHAIRPPQPVGLLAGYACYLQLNGCLITP